MVIPLLSNQDLTPMLSQIEYVITIKGHIQKFVFFFFSVLRSRGAFGSVTVSWEILSSRRSALQDNGDFVKAKGGLIFPNGSNREVLSVVVRRDLVPELNETFYLRLTNVTGDHF